MHKTLPSAGGQPALSEPVPAGGFAAHLDYAHQMANAAGKAILPHFRNLLEADHKGGSTFDPVTIADREAETAIRALIYSHLPDHGVVGEEYPPHNADAEHIWTIDPIDGTRAFIMGLPLWGTLIGLGRGGRPLLGILDQPYIGERFWSDETAAWHRGAQGALRRCQTRKGVPLDRALLSATTPDMFNSEELDRFNALADAVRMRRFGADCYAYGMLALGQIDLVVEAGLKPYDIVPLIPIIERAGGIVTSWDGGDPTKGGRVIACGDSALHEKALAVLNK